MTNLHSQIGDILRTLRIPDGEVLLDHKDLGGAGAIQLFCDRRLSDAACLCEIDAGVIVRDTLKIIVEVDTCIEPCHLSGKFFTPTLAEFANYQSHRVFSVSENAHMVQVLVAPPEARSNRKSQKRDQWLNLQTRFQNTLDRLRDSRIKTYQIFHETTMGDFAEMQNQRELVDHILWAAAG